MAFRKRPRHRADINITPLIDIVFLLLIFFMVTTTFKRESQLTITLPATDITVSATEQALLEVIIDANGHYAVNGLRLAQNSKTSLRAAVQTAAGDNRDQTFLISADGNAPHQAVVTAMELAGELAFRGVSIATRHSQSHQ